MKAPCHGILGGIENFLALRPTFWTGGQPQEMHLALLRRLGFRVVINLGLHDTAYALPDEEAFVKRLGMEYHNIPVDFGAPSLEEFIRFRELVRALDQERAFVHCWRNFRVSCFVALYGESDLEWSRSRSDEVIRRVWTPDAVWSEFLQQVRASLQVLSGTSNDRSHLSDTFGWDRRE